MRYCVRCVLPDTRPGIRISPSGICSACLSHAEKSGSVDWPARAHAFAELAERVKRESRSYDCMIPVSGGKDSTWQVVKCLEYGLTPLTVSWKPPARSQIGYKNLQNLIRLGVAHIDYQVNPEAERKFLLRSFTRFGSTAIPMHMAMFHIPTTIAAALGIRLIVWGENSAQEYSGAGDDRHGFKLDSAWFETYGVTHGTRARDWVADDLTEKELAPYFGPGDEELERAGISAVFLGHYFNWDPAETLRTALAHGFQPREAGPKTGYYNFADIDDDFISIHHWLKWHKFGITRLFDNLSLEIRNGRMSRVRAVEIIRERGDQTPRGDIELFCEFVRITTGRFYEIAESFRNRDIWTCENGIWKIKDFLIPDWDWSR